jgi:hypothetical protein
VFHSGTPLQEIVFWVCWTCSVGINNRHKHVPGRPSLPAKRNLFSPIPPRCLGVSYRLEGPLGKARDLKTKWI